jgi:hypothetical protein
LAPVYVNNVGEFEKPNTAALQFTRPWLTAPHNFLSTVDKNVLDRPTSSRPRCVVRELDRYTRELPVNKHRVLSQNS